MFGSSGAQRHLREDSGTEIEPIQSALGIMDKNVI